MTNPITIRFQAEGLKELESTFKSLEEAGKRCAELSGIATIQPWIDFMKANSVQRLAIDGIEIELASLR